MSRDRKCSPQTLRLLAALAAQPAIWRYGYDLSKDTGLKAGTLYPILTRLAARRLLDSRWENCGQPGRPPRRTHRLTASGLDWAITQVTGRPGEGVPDTLRRARD